MTETIILTSYKSRKTVIADVVTFEANSTNQTVTIGGKTYRFIKNSDYAFKINKRKKTIEAIDGYAGFIKFIKENTQPDDVWNGWLIEVFQKNFHV